MPIKNFTTKVSVSKSVTEIQNALAKAGAQAVMIEYDPQERGLVTCISFKLRVGDCFLASFRLPGRIDGVLITLKNQRIEPRFKTRDHASKVAWRIVRDWVMAQLAIIEADIASLQEVFLPYVDTGDGITLYEKIAASPHTILRLGNSP